jgi:hypothetical protein
MSDHEFRRKNEDLRVAGIPNGRRFSEHAPGEFANNGYEAGTPRRNRFAFRGTVTAGRATVTTSGHFLSRFR